MMKRITEIEDSVEIFIIAYLDGTLVKNYALLQILSSWLK